MAITDYESVPAVERASRSPGLVVMKFGGTSVGDTERLKRVAARCVAASDAGNRVVAVVSAMGKTTDDLIRLAHEISDHPAPRELDMLTSVGERISCALVEALAGELPLAALCFAVAYVTSRDGRQAPGRA